MLQSVHMSSACRLCESCRTRLMFRKGGAPFYQCLDCSFKFQVTDTNANLTTPWNEFERAYVQYLESSPEDELTFAHLSRISNVDLTAPQRILDVGCGSGKFVHYLRQRSMEAYGVEPAQVLFDRYLSRHAYFFNISVEHLAHSSNRLQFDTVMALDVLEHVEYPKAFLAACLTMLKPGGVLWISTPDAESIPARVLGHRWHFYHKWHLSYFSQKLLLSTLSALGYVPQPPVLRSRHRSLGYTIQYGLEFILGLKSVTVPAALNRIALPVNTFDIMFTSARKPV